MRFLLPIVGSILAAVAGVIIALTGTGDIRILGWFLLGLGVFFLSINMAMRKMSRSAGTPRPTAAQRNAGGKPLTRPDA
jgi:hypothetical protein